MSHRYTVGGASFLTRDPLPDLDSDGPADIEFTLRFADLDEFRVAVDTGALPVAGPGSLLGAIDIVDRRCRIFSETTDPLRRAWELRQLAPIFSSVLDHLVLHAAAVEINGVALGFIGGTGVGKSTLVTHLADRGQRLISDDLLPVRFGPVPATLTSEGSLPIGVLCFLDRSADRNIIVDRADSATALHLHMLNGFGEHHHGDTWADQFDGYHRLVEAVPHYSVTIPDDLAVLPAVADAVISLVTQNDLHIFSNP